MPVPYHHLYYDDLAWAIRQAGLSAQAEHIFAARRKEEELHRAAQTAHWDVRDAANNFLANYYQELRPHLRACHQKRFDSGNKIVEVPWP